MKKTKGHPISAFIALAHASAFHDSIKRVQNLVTIYRAQLGHGKPGRRPVHATDVLRAATVLLHAAIEDLLRGVATYCIGKSSSAEVLDRIPLVGLGYGPEPKKFWLGALAQHGDKTVKDLISESVRAHYRTAVTFNNRGDIVRVLRDCSLDLVSVERYLPSLDEMIQRRHRIVHHADKEPRRRFARSPGDRDNRGYQVAKSLSAAEVQRWIVAATRFARKVLDLMSNGEYAKLRYS